MIREALARLAGREDLSEGEMIAVMTEVTRGEATAAQIGAFLMALRVKGVTGSELAGAARVLRSLGPSIRAGAPLVAIDRDEINVDQETIAAFMASGSSGTRTFNVSTATAFAVAACGVRVVRHGLRAVAPLCGSADVLAALGVEPDLTPSAVEDCLETVGIGFFYEPLFHSTIRHVVGPRRELGLRTIFNLLGPLANPAGARCHFVGVGARESPRVLAEALLALGAERALVVRGEDGLDEITVCGATEVAEVREGAIREYAVTPEELGLGRASPEDIAGGDARENAAIVRAVLGGEQGPRRDIVVLNAGAALYAAGVAKGLPEGVRMALQGLDSGGARAKLEALAERTQRLSRGWFREA
ncbi:MAG: anthranilate phosphoribosyltransferase [Deferrisomatales bacterium]|nr:anthranilate phosphoribosyltransferase [Deferrisomatales bacterium]